MLRRMGSSAMSARMSYWRMAPSPLWAQVLGCVPHGEQRGRIVNGADALRLVVSEALGSCIRVSSCRTVRVRARTSRQSQTATLRIKVQRSELTASLRLLSCGRGSGRSAQLFALAKQ